MFKVISGLFFISNFHSSPNPETKISTDFTTYKVASLQRFFHWRTQRTFGIALKNPTRVFKTADYLIVTITFSLIMLGLLFYNMHVHISWCYKSSFLNISCQFVFVFFHFRFLLLSKLACCYLQLVMCHYKKKTSKN